MTLLTKKDLLKLFSMQIAEMEGFYKAQSRAKRNNNPGNLRSWGRFPVVDGYAVFPSLKEGWAALEKQIEKNVFIRGLTFFEFFAGNGKYPGYAPASDKNKPRAYAKFVADAFGTGINTIIKDLVKE